MEWEVNNNETKIIFIKGLKSELIALQEIQQKEDTISSNFNTINIQERTTKRGGGTATIIENLYGWKISKVVKINKDSNLLKINLQNNYIWFLNLYLNQGKMSKIQKLFGILQKNIPINEMSQLLVIGDFNIDVYDQEEKG